MELKSPHFEIKKGKETAIVALGTDNTKPCDCWPSMLYHARNKRIWLYLDGTWYKTRYKTFVEARENLERGYYSQEDFIETMMSVCMI